MKPLPTSAPATPPAAGSERTWQAVRILLALLAAEACVLAWGYGGWLLTLPGKQWATFVALLAAGGLQAHVRRHSEEYRAVRVRWPLAAAQILAFACFFMILRLPSAAGPQPAAWIPAATLGAGLFWFACSMAMIVPRVEQAARLVGVAAALATLAGAAWSVGNFTRTFWRLSGDTTVRLVERLLTPLAGGPIVRPEPFVIGTEAFHVEINDPCSGFHGIGLVTTLLGAYLLWFRRQHRFPQSLLLLPVGMVLMWMANVVRITALILVGIWVSPQIAVDGFHSAAGWIAFLTVGLGLIWLASRSPFFTTPEGLAGGGWTVRRPAVAEPAEVSSTAATGPSAVACLVPFIALTGITLLTRAFTGGFDVLYPIRVVVVAGVLWHLRREFRWRECRVSPLPVAIGLAAFAAWMLLTSDAVMPPSAESDAAPPDPRQLDPMLLGQPWAAAWLVFRTLGSTITVPIAEELFFRGFLTRRCISDDVDGVPIGVFSWFSFVLSSVAFGILHGEAWIAGVVAGMMFAAALYSRRRLFDAVVAHSTTNALLSGYVIATGSWSQWG